MNRPIACQLKLSDLRFSVCLGVSPEEQAVPQPISISVEIDFAVAPLGMKTDKLSDTFCYFAMSKNIQDFVLQQQPFCLVEHLAGCVYASVYHDLLNQAYTDVRLKISVKKLAPPVPNLQDGVTVTYCGILTEGVTDDLYRHWF